MPDSKALAADRRRGVVSLQASIVDRQAMTWKPTLLDPSSVADRAEIGRLTRQPTVRLCDRLRDQLTALVRVEHTGRHMSSLDEAVAIAERLNGVPAREYGSWFHYPWSGALVHVLPVAEFRAVRAERSLRRVPPVERDRLGQARIAIAGLSVGLAVATTLVLDGVGGRFALADFDLLGLSDLNRLTTPVCDLGLNKAVLTARRLLELDPYLQVEIFPDGVTEENIDAFLGNRSPGPSLLVEECDDPYTKVRLRERARELRLPVLMQTSDGAVLDIERFDLEPARELLHGLVPGLTAQALRGMATKDTVAIVKRMLGLGDRWSDSAVSQVEAGQTTSTWPHLASGVALGGALVGEAARRVLLGRSTKSGRCRLDLGRLVDAVSLACDVTTSDEIVMEAQMLA